MSRAPEFRPLPRALRFLLLGCIGLTFGYLLWHSREPLRLDLGDPAADATAVSSLPYRAIHAIGISDIGTLRLFALLSSGLAMWLLFQYARRIWGDTVALIATALFTTSLLWVMHADSLDQAPLVQCSSFFALWALIRAIETHRRRYLAAACVGAALCCVTSYEGWLFLPVAALFTVHIKLGKLFSRGRVHLVVLFLLACAAGILVNALVANGVDDAPLGGELLGRSQAFIARSGATVPTLLRRFTLLFTPMFWITFAVTAWRALRAPSLIWLLEDSATWMLGVATIVLAVTLPRASSQLIGSQVLLPFYAIGSAILIAHLLEGRFIRRGLAVAWIVAAPLWAAYVMLTHPRSVLDRDDVAKATAYLAANDGNDFVMSNLRSDAVIEASFGRHQWAALEAADTTDSALTMLDALASTGTDYIHAVIFTTPESRFLDTSLESLVRTRPLYSVTGWPFLQRGKAKAIIAEYDKRVRKNLDAVGAKLVLHLGNFDLYRIDRAGILETAARSIPVVQAIDFGNVRSNRFKLLGWGDLWLTEDGIAVSSIDGYEPCDEPIAVQRPAGVPAGNACETVPTKAGLEVISGGRARRAQLMIRVAQPCDLKLTFELVSPAPLALTINDFTTPQCAPAKRIELVVPQRAVHAGVNLITLERQLGAKESPVDISSLTIDPVCGAPAAGPVQ